MAAFGIDVGDGRHTACPICGTGRNNHRFRFDDKGGKGTWICNQCGAGDGFKLIQEVLKVDFREACEEIAKVLGSVSKCIVDPEPKTTPKIFRAMLKKSFHTKQGDPVHEYLKGRGLSDLPESLWYCPQCWEYETKTEQQAMLAIFSLQNSEAVTIQRTFIKDGKKMDIDAPRKTMPPLKKMTGGAIRLYPCESGTLGVCEGVETAIAVHEMHGCSVWATTSANLLEAFQPPPGIRRIEVYADNDMTLTGAKSAYVLANRLIVQDKIPASVLIAETRGGDFLDDLIRLKPEYMGA